METAEQQQPEAPAPDERGAPEPEEQERPSTTTEDDGSVSVKLPTRKEEREARKASFRADRDKDGELERLKSERESDRRELQELRGMVMRQSSQQAPQSSGLQAGDPYREEMESIRSEQEHLAGILRGGQIPETESKRIRDRFYSLEGRREEMFAERVQARVQRNAPAPAADPIEVLVRTEFEDVMQHPQASQYARGVYMQLRSEGKPETLATVREAFTKGAERFRLRQAAVPAPSPAQQQRYGAVSAQAGARQIPTEMRLTRDQQRMAQAAYPALTPDEAYGRWAEMFQRSQRE